MSHVRIFRNGTSTAETISHHTTISPRHTVPILGTHPLSPLASIFIILVAKVLLVASTTHRAAERYADVTPEEWERRRQRGWGDTVPDDPGDPFVHSEWPAQSIPGAPQAGPSFASASSSSSRPHLALPTLQLQTDFDVLPSPPIEPDEQFEFDPSQPMPGEPLEPAHLGLNQFGSRFLPHTTAPIRALLPLLGDRLLLIGHDDGLSVLNMFPQEWSDTGLRTLGPAEAQAHAIWTGEGVFQMSLLEVEDVGESTPQGVVLVLAGTDPDNCRDQETHRTLRMYNLSSLISLAKWAVAQRGARPLDMRRPPNWHPQQTQSKKHKSSGSLARGLKSLMLDAAPAPAPPEPPPASFPATALSPNRGSPESQSPDAGWDLVEDLPLRWATDYVPLAAPGSRLLHAPVLSYALCHRGRAALLAVAVKAAVLLYESPKGERAFRFVKEFYTPLPPRSVTFVHQSLPEPLARSASDASGTRLLSPSSAAHARTPPRARHTSLLPPPTVGLDPTLALFVGFDKKAGLIRLADAAVGEVALYDESAAALAPSGYGYGYGSGSARRSRASFDGFSGAGAGARAWAPPVRVELPPEARARAGWGAAVYLLTRARTTHVLPAPLPAVLAAAPPLRTLTWRSAPAALAARVLHVPSPSPSLSPYLSPSPSPASPSAGLVLQLTAFGEAGLEVLEVPLARDGAAPVVRADADVGETGLLCAGGHWHRAFGAAPGGLQRSRSVASVDSVASDELAGMMAAEQGTYGWVRRGGADWRVVWVGGAGGVA
ncbi:hypothetical protein BC834DRAFT_1041995 [Gloeopeniophorella convolvens]|nr:hypothetical protein BC834DRAFT_1041995 [Gloeopeniophorella convolvens]